MHRIILLSLVALPTLLNAQTLTLISGNGQLQPSNAGYSGQPVVFKVTSSSDPNSAGLPGQVITVTSSNGIIPLTANILTTDANGMASATFVPTALNGESSYVQYTLTASIPTSSYLFYETEYYVSSSLAPDAAASLLSPPNLVQGIYNATAGQAGVPIQLSVFTAAGPQGGQALGNISVHAALVAPYGTQTVRCAEAKPIDYEGDVWSTFTENSVVTCTPVFSQPNQALAGSANSYEFEILVGDNFVFGPIRYSVLPAPLAVSGGLVNAQPPYSASLVVTGGSPPYTFTVVGGTFPNGLTLDPSTGVVSGTAAATPGVYQYTVRVTDSSGASVTIPQSIAVSAGPLTPSVSVLTAFVGEQISQDIALTGGVPPLTINNVTGLPSGIAWTAQSDGSILITGTAPTLSAPVPVTISGTDGTKTPVTVMFDLQVVPPLAITSLNPTTVVVGTPFSEQVTAMGGSGVSFSAAGLPPGLSIAPATGLITGTIPAGTAAQQYTTTVTVTDTLGESKQITQVLNVEASALTLNQSAIPPAFVGLPYQVTLPFTGGVPIAGPTPYNVSLGQNPPAGVTLQNGVLSGSFDSTGTVTVPLIVTDATGTPLTAQAVITVENVAFVNAASFNNDGAVAPGEIISIFGSGFGPTDGAAGAIDPTTGNLQTTVAGVQVLFNGTAAPILYVNNAQINAIVPYELTSGSSVAVTVSVNGTSYSVASALAVNSADPGLFAAFPVGYVAGTPVAAIALNAVGSNPLTLNTPSNPVPRGSYIVLYATGGGTISTPLVDGQPAGTNPPVTITDPVTVTIGGQAATVSFAGLAPGFVGLIQVNALVPDSVTPGPSVPVQLSIGSSDTHTEATTIAVQ